MENSIGKEVDVTDPLCPQDNSGSVALLEVSDNGEYDITLNGVAMSEDFDWSNLAADSYTLRIEDIQGCDWDTTIVVNDPVPLSIDLGPDIYIEPGESVQLNIESDFIVEEAMWEDAEAMSCTDCESPVVDPDQTTLYTVTALNDLGCFATDSVTVIVEYPDQLVVIPTAFSPNKDGLNDALTVLAVNGGAHTIVEFKIFDRWGGLVFENYDFPPNDHASGWDGKFKNVDSDVGVYAYYAEVLLEGGRTKILKGNATLIR